MWMLRNKSKKLSQSNLSFYLDFRSVYLRFYLDFTSVYLRFYLDFTFLLEFHVSWFHVCLFHVRWFHVSWFHVYEHHDTPLIKTTLQPFTAKINCNKKGKNVDEKFTIFLIKTIGC